MSTINTLRTIISRLWVPFVLHQSWLALCTSNKQAALAIDSITFFCDAPLFHLATTCWCWSVFGSCLTVIYRPSRPLFRSDLSQGGRQPFYPSSGYREIMSFSAIAGPCGTGFATGSRRDTTLERVTNESVNTGGRFSASTLLQCPVSVGKIDRYGKHRACR